MIYDINNGGLGRRVPTDFEHVEKYPLKALGLETATVVEQILTLPPWHLKHNQGQEGACVGHGVSMSSAITNMIQVVKQGKPLPYIRYNPWWLWDRAKEKDEFPDTNPGDNNGTTVRAAYEVLKAQGHVIWTNENNPKSFAKPDLNAGISAFRWATSIDDVRTAIKNSLAVSIGVNWYSNFDTPIKQAGEYWIGKSPNLGSIRGGHCVSVYGASDRRQAVKIKNSWGKEYPEVWMPYSVLTRLLKEQGEIGVITDR